MQLDKDYLVEADRYTLSDLKLPQLMFELRGRLHQLGGPSDDAKIEWLFMRLNRTPQHRLFKDGLGKRKRADSSSA